MGSCLLIQTLYLNFSKELKNIFPILIISFQHHQQNNPILFHLNFFLKRLILFYRKELFKPFFPFVSFIFKVRLQILLIIGRRSIHIYYLMASREYKFTKLIAKIDPKMTQNLTPYIKQTFNPDKINMQHQNPFTLHPFPPVTLADIPNVIGSLAKSIEELPIKNLSLKYLEHFVLANQEGLLKVLSEKASHCHLFCLVFIRYFQYYAKIKEAPTTNLQLFPFIDLFGSLLQKRKIKKISKPAKNDEKQINYQIHTIFLALTIAATAKYIKQSEQQQLEQTKYTERALIAACLMIEQSQNQAQFEALREYLSVSSNLLIFNGLAMRPLNMLQFSLSNDQKLCLGKQHEFQITNQLVLKYMRALNIYSQKDGEYHKILLKITKNLLTLNINNGMLISHFKILVQVLKGKIYPALKREIFEMLIEKHCKRNMNVIDQIVLLLLCSGIDLLDDDVQKYLLSLAEIGDIKRKEKIAIIYYDQYEKSRHRINESIINFIFDAYLDLNLNFQKIELFVCHETQKISRSSISKLHTVIKERNLPKHVNILSIILEKRTENLEVSKKASPFPFVCEEWLIHGKGNPEIYTTYLRIITQTLCGKTLQINPLLINVSSVIVRVSFNQHSKIQDRFFSRSLEFYSIILKLIEQNKVFQQTMFRYMVLLQALFGDHLPLSSYCYFSKNFSKIINPESTFLTYLQYLVTLLKNKSSVLLYLQSVLEFQMNLNQLFYQKKLYDISFLARLIQESEFFSLSTYSLESVTVIYQLSLIVKDKEFQEDYIKILRHWSSFMTRAECKNLSYFFAFREIKKIYPFMKERQLKNPSDRIKLLWDMIFNLIDQKTQSREYISMSPNNIIVVWKGDESNKKEINISGIFLRNRSIELSWQIHIKKTNKKTYTISVNNQKVTFSLDQIKLINKVPVESKQVLKEIKFYQLKKRPESVSFCLKLENFAKKTICNFSVFEMCCPESNFDGNISSIEIKCTNNAILKEIIFTDTLKNGQLREICDHIHQLNQWEVKVSSLNKYCIQNFSNKFDYSHAYCCIGQMLKHFSHITIPFAFDIFIRLSTRLIKQIHQQGSTELLNMMVQVFNRIESTYSCLRGRNKVLKPIIQLQTLQEYGSQLYYLYTTALLPHSFWSNFDQQTKNQLTKKLKSLFKVKKFIQLENKSLILFSLALQIIFNYEPFFEICDLIIENHELNETLNTKFHRLILLAKDSSIYGQCLSKILQKNLKFLNIIQNEKFVDNRVRCQFLISNPERIKQIFCFCTIDSKIDLLHNLSQNPSFDSKGQPDSLIQIKQLMERIDLTEKYQIMPMIIIEAKKFINQFKTKNKHDNTYSFRVNYLHLQLLILNRYACHQDEKDSVFQLIFDLLTLLSEDVKKEKNKGEIERFLHSNIFMSFIIETTKEILAKYGQIKKIDNKNIVSKVFKLSMDIISKLSKDNLLEFLIKYRCKCSQQFQLLKLPIQLQQFRNLTLSSFSIFLQYLFEVLLLIEQRVIPQQKQIEEVTGSITQYIEFLFHSIDDKTKIAKSLFYAYPHLLGQKEGMKDTTTIIKRMNMIAEKTDLLELRGGIYFKCVLIIVKLMKLNFNLDYTNLVSYFLFGPKKAQKQEKNIKTIQFSSNSAFIKERSTAELYAADATQTFRAYFNKEDSSYKSKSQQIDLTVYIADYLLMNIAELLQQFSEEMDSQLLDRYSNIFLLGCSNQKICKEFSISNSVSEQILTYKDACRSIEEYNNNRGSRQNDSYSPLSQKSISSPSKANRTIHFYDEFCSQNATQASLSKSPKRRLQRRKSEDFSNDSKKKTTQKLEMIKFDSKSWFNKGVCKNISTYFGDKAKEIRIIELFHTHFVLKNSAFVSTVVTPSKIKERYDEFIASFEEKIREELNYWMGEVNLQKKLRKVKKIKPYTSSQSPVLNILQNSLGNMACPITLKITKTDYHFKKLKSQQSMNMNYYSSNKTQENDLKSSLEDSTELLLPSLARINSVDQQLREKQHQEQQRQLSKEKPYCELVTKQGVYFCQYHLKTTGLILQSKLERIITEKLWYLKLGTPDENLLHTQIKVEIHPEEVLEIFYRKFNQITNNSLEFFMKNGTSKFISFYKKQTVNMLVRHLQKVFKKAKIIKDAAKQFEQAKYTQRWVDGYLSNFDYLMLLNKYSGRSYNDVNQYYVFPWVLKEYRTDRLDLSSPDVYRELDKPIGALNPEKLKKYKDNYKTQPYHNEKALYGSHYSASLFIFYYLVRLEPFSSLRIMMFYIDRDMQKGTWDVADRLFCSIQQVWQSLMSESSATDIKECIPEFYYMPAFLRNIAQIQLGQKQCGTDVGDVELPIWARDAEQFIVTMRAALQSDYVSQNLHLWIDLIFGKHQNSQEKNNVFHPYSYSDPEVLSKFNRNQKNIDGIICQISYFGQCPIQLFKKQHKPKKSRQNRPRSYKSIQTGRNSQSTSSQIFWGESYLPIGRNVINISCENNEFILELWNQVQQEKHYAYISMFASPNETRQNLQNVVSFKKNEPKQSYEPKIQVNKDKQLLIGKQFIMDLDFNFPFEHTEINELWIACFGLKGIKIFNWQLQQSWSWKLDEVKEVSLQPTRLIFSTPNGKLYFFSFLDRRLQSITAFKDVYDMKIKVARLPRLPSRQRNQINYKILCVGDGFRVSIVSYTFQQIFNCTSLSRHSN